MAYEEVAEALGKKNGEALVNHPMFPDLIKKRRKEMKTEEQFKSNIWENKPDLDKVISVIKKLTNERDEGRKLVRKGLWSWVLNSRCKYISIRIDMRDGEFVLLDRDKKRITLEQLEYQYDSSKEPN